MQGNNELVVPNIQPTVKDGENEELFKRMRALEEVVNREREEADREEQKKLTLKGRENYHKAIAAFCAKYRGLDKEVVLRLGNEDKERLADSIEEKVRKKRRWQNSLGLLQFLVGGGVFGSLSYFAHPAFLLLFIMIPLRAPIWLGDLQTGRFLDYRKQTKKEDRIALEAKVELEAKQDGT